ncbi:MAG: flagellar hook capping protein [Firmicutes bacterium]|nr:flagellar hook capping protein [Bacillota bacterium]
MITVTATGSSGQDNFMQNTGNNAELDKHAFLTLLITQLRYQDPLKPSDNGEFLAQMAQFSSLEQTQNISEGIDTLITLQSMHQNGLFEKVDNLNQNMADLLSLSQFAHFTSFDAELLLLGKEVTMKTEAGQEIVGKVSSVQLDSTGNKLMVDGQVFTLTQLIKVNSGD